MKTRAFSLPTAKITNPDVTRLINSDEIQSVVRPANAKVQKRPWTQHKNPLVNKAVLFRLNPYAKTLRRQELRTYLYQDFSYISTNTFTTVKQERIKAKKQSTKKSKDRSAGDAFLKTLFAP